MGYSELKFKIQSTKLKHEQEREQMNARHQQEIKKLLSQCTHKYDDGTSAKVIWEGSHRMHWGYKCDICGCNL